MRIWRGNFNCLTIELVWREEKSVIHLRKMFGIHVRESSFSHTEIDHKNRSQFSHEGLCLRKNLQCCDFSWMSSEELIRRGFLPLFWVSYRNFPVHTHTPIQFKWFRVHPLLLGGGYGPGEGEYFSQSWVTQIFVREWKTELFVLDTVEIQCETQHVSKFSIENVFSQKIQVRVRWKILKNTSHRHKKVLQCSSLCVVIYI